MTLILFLYIYNFMFSLVNRYMNFKWYIYESKKSPEQQVDDYIS